MICRGLGTSFDRSRVPGALSGPTNTVLSNCSKSLEKKKIDQNFAHKHASKFFFEQTIFLVGVNHPELLTVASDLGPVGTSKCQKWILSDPGRYKVGYRSPERPTKKNIARSKKKFEKFRDRGPRRPISHSLPSNKGF